MNAVQLNASSEKVRGKCVRKSELFNVSGTLAGVVCGCSFRLLLLVNEIDLTCVLCGHSRNSY